jgi:hypothetical protein
MGNNFVNKEKFKKWFIVQNVDNVDGSIESSFNQILVCRMSYSDDTVPRDHLNVLICVNRPLIIVCLLLGETFKWQTF